ncbi:MAG: hypothetical protein Q9166_001961 [cf. Caloplaca sp. 2 TL-2023]
MLADGLCVIEIDVPAFGVSDESSGFEISRAAWATINTCVADYKHGGRVDELGLLKRLSVHVSSYDPHVRCAPPGSPPAPLPGECDNIIDQMETSKKLQDFAPQGTPHLDFVIPFALVEPNGACTIVIRQELFKETTVTTSWYDIWAAAIAVRQLCVVQGRSGQAIDLGYPSNLLVQIMKGRPEPRTEQPRHGHFAPSDFDCHHMFGHIIHGQWLGVKKVDKYGVAFRELIGFVRGLQFVGSSLVTGIAIYWLIVLTNHHAGNPIWIRAVAGMSGAGILQSLFGAVLVFYFANNRVLTALACIIDIIIVSHFTAIAALASLSKAGSRSCGGRMPPSLLGPGNRITCWLMMVVFVTSIVMAPLFVASAVLQVLMHRHHRRIYVMGGFHRRTDTSG